MSNCMLHDGGNCEFIDPDTCPTECGFLVDCETQIKKLKAERDQWKELAQSRYTKMVDTRLEVKNLEKTNELLRQTLNRRDQMIEFLR